MIGTDVCRQSRKHGRMDSVLSDVFSKQNNTVHKNRVKRIGRAETDMIRAAVRKE